MMIDVNNLHYSYPGNKTETIRGIDFSIAKGEIFGFLGPSGAGKSTTQKIIIGILKRYHGYVNILGKELTNHDSSYYENIGVAFEFPNLYGKLTAMENLKFFGSLYSGDMKDPKHLLNVVGLESDANTRVSEFSKGMKMRLNFVRAFMNNPEIAFLDEPTTGLDPVNAKKIKDYILERKLKGKTIFLTTHNMHDAEDLCDRVAFIVDGKINLIDTPRQLKLHNGKKSVRIEYIESNSLKVEEFNLSDIGSNKQFLSIIKEKKIETIHTQEATLEDVFIDITGRTLK